MANNRKGVLTTEVTEFTESKSFSVLSVSSMVKS